MIDTKISMCENIVGYASCGYACVRGALVLWCFGTCFVLVFVRSLCAGSGGEDMVDCGPRFREHEESEALIVRGI